MGYKIVYLRRKKEYLRNVLLITGSFMVIMLLLYVYIPDGMQILRGFFVTEAAEVFAERLQAGDSIADAVAAFGQELIDGQ